MDCRVKPGNDEYYRGAEHLRPRANALIIRTAGLAQRAIIDVADRDRPPCQCTAEPAGEFQRLASVERGVDRLEIGGAGIGGDPRGRKKQAPAREDLPCSL